MDFSDNKKVNNNNGPTSAIVSAVDDTNRTTSATTGTAETSVDTASSLMENILPENILPGNASLTVPTTSLHLAKLALDPTATTTTTGTCILWVNILIASSMFVEHRWIGPRAFFTTDLTCFFSSVFYFTLFYFIFRSGAESWWDRETAAGEWKGCVVARRTARTR